MLSLMPFGFMFISVLVFGSILSLSSLHWLTIWAGLEINLMGFIPILIYRGLPAETESAMKYFVVQALGSGMLMLGSILSFSLSLTWEKLIILNYSMGSFILVFGLLTKLGSFPFHFWVPQVMAGISWLGCLLLTTWQKLAPLFILAAFMSTWMESSKLFSAFILSTAGISSLVGGIGGLNQTQIRALLAYSSIGHIGWMLLSASLSFSTLKIYFLIYFLVSVSLFMTLWAIDTSLFNQTGTLKINQSKVSQLSITFMLLSLGGMPPLLGFLGKWFVIWHSCVSGLYLILLPFLAGSLISLFYYLTLMFSVTLFSSAKLSMNSLTLWSKGLGYLDWQTMIKSTKEFDQFFYPDQANFTGSPPFSLYQTLLPLITLLFMANMLGGLLIGITLPLFDFL